MALDLGTLQLQISANTGDAINRLDTVKSSAEDLEKHNKITLNVEAKTEGAQEQINTFSESIKNISDGSASVDLDTSSATEGLNSLLGTVTDMFSSTGSNSLSSIMGGLDISGLLTTLGVNGAVVAGVGLAGAFATVALEAANWFTGNAVTGSIVDTLTTLGGEFDLLRAKTQIFNYEETKEAREKWIKEVNEGVDEAIAKIAEIAAAYDDVATAATKAGMTPEEMSMFNKMSSFTEMGENQAIKLYSGINAGWADEETAKAFAAAGMNENASTWQNMAAMAEFLSTMSTSDAQAWMTSNGFSERDYQAMTTWISDPAAIQEWYAKLEEFGIFMSEEEIDKATTLNDINDLNTLLGTSLDERSFNYTVNEAIAAADAKSAELAAEIALSDALTTYGKDSEEYAEAQAEWNKAHDEYRDKEIALTTKLAEYNANMKTATAGNSVDEEYLAYITALTEYQNNPNTQTKQQLLTAETTYIDKTAGIKGAYGEEAYNNLYATQSQIDDLNLPAWLLATAGDTVTYGELEAIKKAYTPASQLTSSPLLTPGTGASTISIAEKYNAEGIDDIIAQGYGFATMDELLASLPEEVAAAFEEDAATGKIDLASGDLTGEDYYYLITDTLGSYLTGKDAEGDVPSDIDWTTVSTAQQEAADTQKEAGEKQKDAADKNSETADKDVSVSGQVEVQIDFDSGSLTKYVDIN